MCAKILTVAFLLLAMNSHRALAQHCAPILESYLSDSKVTRTADGIGLHVEYTKSGGRAHPAYQAYVLAFSERDARQVSQMTPQEAISSGLATIVDTQLMQRTETGEYQLNCEFKTDQLVQQMLVAQRISIDRVNDIGGWKSFEDRLQLAVFIPFLDDQQYSTLPGLPEDRHECNYAKEAALLFETLPPHLSIHFGIVLATTLPEGSHYIAINGNRPKKIDGE